MGVDTPMTRSNFTTELAEELGPRIEMRKDTDGAHFYVWVDNNVRAGPLSREEATQVVDALRYVRVAAIRNLQRELRKLYSIT